MRRMERMTSSPTKTVAAPETPVEPAGLEVHAAGLSDRGRVRQTNQDQYLVAELARALHVRQSSVQRAGVYFGARRGQLLLLADGAGGHAGGEQASALAVDTIESLALNTLRWVLDLRSEDENQVLPELQAALRGADSRIFDETAQRPELRGMATTLTMAYALGDRLYVVHVGDSRCYLLRRGELHLLTRDHTLVNDLVSRGAIRPEDAAGHRLRHVITNAVGGHEPGLQAEAHRLDLEVGDTVLLCSDGLHSMVDHATIARLLAAEPDPAHACRALVDEANARGGEDNVTVVVARFERPAP